MGTSTLPDHARRLDHGLSPRTYVCHHSRHQQLHRHGHTELGGPDEKSPESKTPPRRIRSLVQRCLADVVVCA